MKNLISLIILLLLIALYSGCTKDDGSCITSTGKMIRENRVALPFHFVEVYDNINLFLKQDTALTSISVEAGENLIGGITTEIDSGRLVLRNRNTCNWLRNFSIPVNVYLTFTKLDTLVFRAAGNVTCINTWTNDSIFFNVIEGAGRISLNLNMFKSFIHIQYGTVRLDAAGFSQVTFISSQGYGPLHAEELVSKFTYVYTFSPNDVFVYASEQLGVEIGNTGNIYYRGNPGDIKADIYGSGKLIPF
ncbi:MAG: DUF2807 domain-containing protein [Bacteroidales bacterium]|jgi:hypothetical protein